MKFSDIKNALKHLIKTNRCLHCQGQYDLEEINIIATTKLEGLFEMHCGKCHLSSIMTVVVSPEIEVKKTNPGNITEKFPGRSHGGISPNDILDVKNFLNNFDGDFKKLFTNDNK